MNIGRRRIAFVADVGGTRTRVAVADGNAIVPGSVRRYLNAEWRSFEDLAAKFAQNECRARFDSACVAFAGPVNDGRTALTNSDWAIDADALRTAIGATQTVLINDLQALGHSLAILGPGEIKPVLKGRKSRQNATRLVVGVGTGFNAAVASYVNGTWHVSASECGHSGLHVRNAEEFALAIHISEAAGFASMEDVLSGPGIETTYSWLASGKYGGQHKCAGSILDAAASGQDQAAVDTERIVVGLLGSVCGDLALIHLPFGGIYLAGGVARALVPRLEKRGYAEAFLGKGRFSEFMDQFSVGAIEDDFAALKGCAAYLASLG
ncbi:MAG: glucokinase [Albidovulum sp.]|nr:glucokinase [Albidovulum sp.]